MPLTSVHAQLFDQNDLNSVVGQTPFYDPEDTCSSSSGSTSDSTPSDNSTLTSGSSIYILGDSITELAQPTYVSSFQQKGITANVDASVSRSLGGDGTDGNKLSGLAAITADAAEIQKSQAIVIALGTNGGDTNQSIVQAINEVKSYNTTAPIYWVDTISVGRTDGYNQSVIGPNNQAIYSQASSENYSVISWFKAVDPNGNPEDPSGAEVDPNHYIDTGPDGYGVHPDPAGVTALVNLVVDTVTGSSSTATPPSNPCCSGSTVSLVGSTNAAEAYNYFTGEGLSAAQATGIMGNMEAESGILPERLESTPASVITPAASLNQEQLSDGNLGWGTVQWSPPEKMIIPTEQAKKDPNDLGVQFEFLWQQLNTDEGAALTALKTTTTPEAAALSFEVNYERPYVPQGYTQPQDAPVREAFAQAFYEQYANGVPLPPGVQAPSSTESSGCSNGTTTSSGGSAPTTTGISAYMDPLRAIKPLTPLRIDQGVDYEGKGPIYALGAGVVISVNTTDSGWPGLGTTCQDGTPCNGAFIKYELSDGPAKGDYVYFAEDCVPVVAQGAMLTTSTVICNMYEGGTNIETGWTTKNPGEQALAAAQYQANGYGSYATSAGQNFSDLLQALGAPPGVFQGGAGDAGPPTLSGFPNW